MRAVIMVDECAERRRIYGVGIVEAVVFAVGVVHLRFKVSQIRLVIRGGDQKLGLSPFPPRQFAFALAEKRLETLSMRTR